MTITKLADYSVTCDLCQAPGGTWNGRKCPEDALPEGWAIVRTQDEYEMRHHGEGTMAELVLCPECQKGVQ